MEFWLDKIIRQTRIPYPIFFGLIGLFLYLLGIPIMSATGNLQYFFSEPRWILMAVFGALLGILVIFVFRKFSDSLNTIKHLIGSKSEFQKLNYKLLGHLTNKVYWIIVVFWIVIASLNFTEAFLNLYWWRFYDQPNIVTVYYLIAGLPVFLFGGIFMYTIPFGMTWAYRELCLKTSFKEDLLVSEWMEPFKRFKNLITLTMLVAVVISIFPYFLWAPTMEQTPLILLPYTSMAIILVPTIVFPHYFFHKLFSRVKENRLRGFRRELSQIHEGRKRDSIRNIRLLLEKSEMEKIKTWLLDIKILVEIIVIALMHVILIEVLTTIIH